MTQDIQDLNNFDLCRIVAAHNILFTQYTRVTNSLTYVALIIHFDTMLAACPC